ncbi:cupin domain-containing protein [Stetteria hydrogenophila]
MSGEGSCGKVVRYSDVEAQPLPEDMATGAFVRWLIAERDGARNFYMRLFEVKPGGHIKAHYHPWEHEIFVLEGGGEVRIGGRWHRVEAGHAIFIPPNVEHEYKASESGLKFICVIPARPTAEEAGQPVRCD